MFYKLEWSFSDISALNMCRGGYFQVKHCLGRYKELRCNAWQLKATGFGMREKSYNFELGVFWLSVLRQAICSNLAIRVASTIGFWKNGVRDVTPRGGSFSFIKPTFVP